MTDTPEVAVDLGLGWPPTHRCTDVRCGHQRSLHVEPMTVDGRCTDYEGGACSCLGWDPMTKAEWSEAWASLSIPDGDARRRRPGGPA